MVFAFIEEDAFICS